MPRLIRYLLTVALAAAGLAAAAAPASAAHNGNNRAEVTGSGDPDAHGDAVVNYREGTGTFNGTISVRSLDPGETYTFLVRSPAGAETPICSDEASPGGVFSCSEQDLRLGGFTRAVVRDESGTEVAGGMFDRRGNCRDPQQNGSQCNAPGRTR